MEELKNEIDIREELLSLDEPPAPITWLLGGDDEKMERIAEHRLQLASIRKQYLQNADGKLVINPDEKNTVKLAFYMYLYGYSTQQIADAFIALEKASYKGNTTKWTPTGIVQILRNERHCGDVLTRKTYTPNYRDHKKAKNVK